MAKGVVKQELTEDILALHNRVLQQVRHTALICMHGLMLRSEGT